jgi:transcriptional regulator with XRE-family HTH domain
LTLCFFFSETIMQPRQEPKTTPTLHVSSSEELGEVIRSRRQAQRLRIDDAAELCGISVAALSRLETANGGVRLESLLKVLDGLGLAFVVTTKDSPLIATLRRADEASIDETNPLR